MKITAKNTIPILLKSFLLIIFLSLFCSSIEEVSAAKYAPPRAPIAKIKPAFKQAARIPSTAKNQKIGINSKVSFNKRKAVPINGKYPNISKVNLKIKGKLNQTKLRLATSTLSKAIKNNKSIKALKLNSKKLPITNNKRVNLNKVNLSTKGINNKKGLIKASNKLTKSVRPIKKLLDKRQIKLISNKKNIVSTRRAGGATNIKKGALLKEHLRQTEKYGKGGVKKLNNGQIRYYGKMVPSKKAGTMAGRRTVRQWDPTTGNKRTWHETLDHKGNVRQIRPENNNGSKKHYKFDSNGRYIGSW